MSDDTSDYSVLREPLLCCGGERTTLRYDGSVDGRQLVLVAVSHELWCCEAAPAM
jgi:hypothetical protein